MARGVFCIREHRVTTLSVVLTRYAPTDIGPSGRVGGRVHQPGASGEDGGGYSIRCIARFVVAVCCLRDGRPPTRFVLSLGRVYCHTVLFMG
jgi:hypothetical protein